jgi:hypothetical protein
VHANEKLTAFLELEFAICACGEFVGSAAADWSRWPAGKVFRLLFGKRNPVPGNCGTAPEED